MLDEELDLKAFNYEEMENLKISTPEEVSVWDAGQDEKEK